VSKEWLFVGRVCVTVVVAVYLGHVALWISGRSNRSVILMLHYFVPVCLRRISQGLCADKAVVMADLRVGGELQ
jgi:hypothetical protein